MKPHAVTSVPLLTAAGLATIGGALGWLALTGRTEVSTSADAEATPVPLLSVVVALAVGLLLTRLVPPRLPVLAPAGDEARAALTRQVSALVGIAVGFALLALALGPGSVWYGPLKVAVLLGGAWLVLRVWPAPSPGGREHRRAVPVWWYWLGPLPAIAGWAWLAYYSPLATTTDLSGYREYDPAFLITAMLLTFLTASVLEEIFYRAVLQTRLEALLGRWPAIAATALLFAAMHTHRIGSGPLAETVAVVLVFNGGFGLFLGYLWARYRNIWALILAHGAVNSLTLLPIFFA
ncbi:CPBP family intramembrane glutamic endopeptidase [Micromonospora sp. NBC_01813]|uniref:CPBP family intramembrane glutamic endopeptidase n=1 Tax=Micromonospora sp. NBC_01813 TaxID=2975988 RepID=UPI002DDB526C|nr:CPBP family intramembrane glutamic endopeptidase [Micromonospora sp. NBC_01813]WSA09983.1 CPBP family intramembrane metalloprotease [Micromonospora sp. NBC_01813]